MVVSSDPDARALPQIAETLTGTSCRFGSPHRSTRDGGAQALDVMPLIAGAIRAAHGSSTCQNSLGRVARMP